ncbi:PAAR domain-containing protein [Moraxella equi]|uniref:Uncharacterized conserved protein n=1 Tax=Moraxella equi TaxID=60442 RepID=A0A378QVW8_9GAMM|nr:PAAR domain-containing protein [Moraxella equi]OPH37918.1 hypothetical protein B5J93_07480 [Moraxella equi]STZ03583.1 Uncharacterized conserved protein [Moraxella equi]
MSVYPAIRQGDTTTHGGTVITASSNLNIYGKTGACMGDMVTCPKCRGTFPIIEGASSVNTFGKSLALDGMMTACGAELIASQSQFVVEITKGQGVAHKASDNTNAITPLFDEQFVLQSEDGTLLTGMVYELKFSDGSIIKGVTCDEGCTERIQADTALELVEISYPVLIAPSQGDCCSASAEIAMYDLPINQYQSQPTLLTNSLIGISKKILQLIFGKYRGLTENERKLVMPIFKDSIDYDKVKIHHGRFIPIFQPSQTAMTPFGTIHFPDDIYEEDYANPTQNLINPNIIQHLFVHEMTHVWQYQLGYSPFLNGIIIALKGGYINNKAYEYLSKVQSNQDLSDFNMEQQGSIIADYFIDTTNNHTSPSPHPYTKGMPLIDSILKEFKNNPSNKQLLPRDNHA